MIVCSKIDFFLLSLISLTRVSKYNEKKKNTREEMIDKQSLFYKGGFFNGYEAEASILVEYMMIVELWK